MSPETQKVIEMVKIIIRETKFPFDQTKRGRIISILPNNKYVVKINDITYEIKSHFIYSENETVFVLFPQGKSNSEDLYIYPNR